jgi:hypothetical protein
VDVGERRELRISFFSNTIQGSSYDFTGISVFGAENLYYVSLTGAIWQKVGRRGRGEVERVREGKRRARNGLHELNYSGRRE